MRSLLRKIPVNSIRFRISAGMGIVVIALLLLLLFSNVYSINVVRNQVYEANQQTMSWYARQLDASLLSIDRYLVGLETVNNDLRTVGRPQNEVDFQVAQSHLKRDLEAALPSYGILDALYVTNPGLDMFLDCAGYSITGQERREMRQTVLAYLATNESNPRQGNSRWIVVQGEENKYYLLRLLNAGPVYYGAWINLSNIIPELYHEGLKGMEGLLFCTNDGKPLDLQVQADFGTLALPEGAASYIMVGSEKKYMLLSQPMSRCDISLVALIRDNSILEGLDSIRNLIITLILISLVFLPLFGLLLRRWILLPLYGLINVIRKLAAGNLDARPDSTDVPDEFQTVNQAFEAMSQQIKKLKIDVYEERIRKKENELQYLQLQVNPHFTINCLNIIHNLAAVQKYTLIQNMVEHLGNHLRYTLNGISITTLAQEINHVKNYIELQKLRFPGSLACRLTIDAELIDAAVPPLCIQTFVENTIKYQVTAGEITELNLYIERTTRNGLPYVHIVVEDSGEGYPEAVLQAIKENRRIMDGGREHIGITNLIHRLDLLYEGKAELTLSNHPKTGGACAGIEIPYVKYDEGVPV